MEFYVTFLVIASILYLLATYTLHSINHVFILNTLFFVYFNYSFTYLINNIILDRRCLFHCLRMCFMYFNWHSSVFLPRLKMVFSRLGVFCFCFAVFCCFNYAKHFALHRWYEKFYTNKVKLIDSEHEKGCFFPNLISWPCTFIGYWWMVALKWCHLRNRNQICTS